MKAKVGDWLVIERARLGQPRKAGKVVAVPKADGSPPYRVRWSNTDRVTVVYPGPDARIEEGAARGE
ncbi:DUF1918 domain-containing protein [Allokutzneria oryzae]|uniref:DUF1918 domain-containing protein n=1 Tax=Allokutzneria oryzae TaxID=1378989 RepID=A0ABV5ZUE2_9PSEU